MTAATQASPSPEADAERCVAPGCAVDVGGAWEWLCDPCCTRVEDAMRVALPALRAAMTEARAEVEQFLAGDWSPRRQWVLLDQEGHLIDPSRVVGACVDLATESLGFVDPVRVAKDLAWQRTDPPSPPKYPPTGWIIGSDSPTAAAWRAHVGVHLRIAIQEALDTFPAAYAGEAIKDGLLQRNGFGPEELDGTLQELLDFDNPFSDDGDLYVRLAYDPDPSYLAHADCPDDAWWRHRVLSDEIMAILDRVREAEAPEREAAAERRRARQNGGAPC